MKICCAVPENGRLIYMHYRCGGRKKKQKQKKQTVKHIRIGCVNDFTHYTLSLWSYPSSPTNEMNSLARCRSFLLIAITFENASWRNWSRRTLILMVQTHTQSTSLHVSLSHTNQSACYITDSLITGLLYKGLGTCYSAASRLEQQHFTISEGMS